MAMEVNQAAKGIRSVVVMLKDRCMSQERAIGAAMTGCMGS